MSAVAIYAFVAAAMYGLQRQLMYFPETQRLVPEEVGLSGVEDIDLATPDGERLVLWYAAPEPGKPVVLFFHGNAGAMYHRRERFIAFQQQGFGVAFPSYRGFAGSSGAPGEETLVADALLVHDWLVARGVPADRIFVIGESLGSGVAVQLAASRRLAGLILEAPFYSAVDVAAEVYPWLPVRLLMQDRFDSSAFIDKNEAPLLIIHGTADEVIPVDQGRRLFAAARDPKEMIEIEGARHSFAGPAVFAREIQFIENLFADAGQ